MDFLETCVVSSCNVFPWHARWVPVVVMPRRRVVGATDVAHTYLHRALELTCHFFSRASLVDSTASFIFQSLPRILRYVVVNGISSIYFPNHTFAYTVPAGSKVQRFVVRAFRDNFMDT
jgi:hypothetical protein